jgi:TonB-linked SusC/RagA family outer membrane protein
MRFIVLLLTTALLHAHASGLAQDVTLSGKSIQLKDVFNAVKSQTGYQVFYSDPIIKLAKPVTVSARQMPLDAFLKEVFNGQPALKYTIRGKTIFVMEKALPSIREPQLSNLLDAVDFRPIKGRVVDSAGNALPGATIGILNSRIVVTTDAQGMFSIDIKKGDILVVSFVGYQTKELKISDAQFNGTATIAIQLFPAISSLEEVAIVNTGYQRINRINTTGSSVLVGSGELSKRNATNILQNLEGTVPGLVQYRGNATIRGVSTIQANNRILVVVDGLPIEGTIADINPYDVESVTVLKDAAAASIYGARASNGVIVVTTKRAKERNKTSIELSGNLTITNKPDYSYNNYMTPAQQVDWESKYYEWWFNGGGGTVPDPITQFENNVLKQGNFITPVQYAWYQAKKNPGDMTQAKLETVLNGYKQNDFQKQFRNEAVLNQVIQQYNFAIRTNNGRSQNNLVINYTTDNGGIINAYSRQLNLFYKGAYSVGKWLDMDYGVNTVQGRFRSHNSDFAKNPFNVPSYINLLNPDGSRAYYTTNQFNAYNKITDTSSKLFSVKFNHLDELERDHINTSTSNTRYYVNLNFKILPGLSFNPMFQYEDNRRDSSIYSEAESYTMRWLQNVYTTRTTNPLTYTNLLPPGGKLATTNAKSPAYTARGQINFDREYGLHRFIALAGAEFRQTRVYGTKGLLLGYDDQLQTQQTANVNFASLFAINTGTIWSPNYPVRQYDFPDVSAMGLIIDEKHRFGSGYANLTYTYDRKYNLFGSLRKDYADLFGGDEKYRGKPLWSVGASWIASNEDFLQDYTMINFLKVRGSYGLTGNIRNVTAFLAATTGVNPITRLPNAAVTNPPNPALRWEKTATLNLGVDFVILDNRLRGALDFYRRKGTDLFAQKRLDPSEGFTSMTINNASMLNHGFEFNLAYDWIRPAREGGFRWSSGLMGAWNKNKITAVDELNGNPITVASGGSYRVGYPVRSIFSFQFAGLDAGGIPQWNNAKGEPTTLALGPADGAALVFSGDADPRRNLAFNNEVGYKGFSLSIYAVYYGGHYFRARPIPFPFPSPAYAALPSYLLNSWTPTNTNTDVPGAGQYYQVPVSNQYYYSDNLVRRADFLKIRNIVLAYDLPGQIAAKIRSAGLRFRFQVNDPKAIWARQDDVHIDPETGGAPIPASFVFGINANF